MVTDLTMSHTLGMQCQVRRYAVVFLLLADGHSSGLLACEAGFGLIPALH